MILNYNYNVTHRIRLQYENKFECYVQYKEESYQKHWEFSTTCGGLVDHLGEDILEEVVANIFQGVGFRFPIN